jgi:hypothetical protein
MSDWKFAAKRLVGGLNGCFSPKERLFLISVLPAFEWDAHSTVTVYFFIRHYNI